MGDKLTGRVLNIQRMSTEDGPGLRTTVFFKGCSLACTWCHNPESISALPQTVWHASRCIGCRTCDGICREGAIAREPDGVRIDRDRCKGCGECAEECPAAALELLGREWAVDDLIAEVSKDRVYFESSGGGVSVSGGEPAVQAPFAAAFLDGCRKAGLHLALDTCGQCRTGQLLELARSSHMVLYDLKLIDPERHRALTGRDNSRILDNLLALRDLTVENSRPPELWIRTPLVPGVTDSEDNLLGIGRFLVEHDLVDKMERWELCAFNNLCREQYGRLGRTWEFASEPLLAPEHLERCAEYARAAVADSSLVIPTGATRTPDTMENA